jgi:hypothetical protein
MPRKSPFPTEKVDSRYVADSLASHAQFRSRIKDWGLRKNVSKRKMIKILWEQARRRAAGKRTVVLFRQQLIDDYRLGIARKRYQREVSALSSPICRTPWPTSSIVTLSNLL